MYILSFVVCHCVANTHERKTRQWKVLVTDETSSKVLENVVEVDDILSEDIKSMLADPRLTDRDHFRGGVFLT